MIVPVYPLTVNPATVGAISRLQVPKPLALKTATSVAPGTDAPPGPPEEVDQLAVLFQFDDDEAIQNRFWPKMLPERMVRKLTNSTRAYFFIEIKVKRITNC